MNAVNTPCFRPPSLSAHCTLASPLPEPTPGSSQRCPYHPGVTPQSTNTPSPRQSSFLCPDPSLASDSVLTWGMDLGACALFSLRQIPMPSSWKQVGRQGYSTYQGWPLLPTGICASRRCRWALGAPHTCSPCPLPPRLPFPWPGPAGRRLPIPSRLLEGNLESPGIRARDREWERRGGEQGREKTQIPNPALVPIRTMIMERPLGFSIHFHNLAQGITKAPHFRKHIYSYLQKFFLKIGTGPLNHFIMSCQCLFDGNNINLTLVQLYSK